MQFFMLYSLVRLLKSSGGRACRHALPVSGLVEIFLVELIISFACNFS